jgi:hypothetical protein
MRMTKTFAAFAFLIINKHCVLVQEEVGRIIQEINEESFNVQNIAMVRNERGDCVLEGFGSFYKNEKY